MNIEYCNSSFEWSCGDYYDSYSDRNKWYQSHPILGRASAAMEPNSDELLGKIESAFGKIIEEVQPMFQRMKVTLEELNQATNKYGHKLKLVAENVKLLKEEYNDAAKKDDSPVEEILMTEEGKVFDKMSALKSKNEGLIEMVKRKEEVVNKQCTSEGNADLLGKTIVIATPLLFKYMNRNEVLMGIIAENMSWSLNSLISEHNSREALTAYLKTHLPPPEPPPLYVWRNKGNSKFIVEKGSNVCLVQNFSTVLIRGFQLRGYKSLIPAGFEAFEFEGLINFLERKNEEYKENRKTESHSTKMSRLAGDKVVDTKNSTAIGSNWISSTTDFVWKKRNALMSRSLIFPKESFRATVYPRVYAVKAVASGPIEMKKLSMSSKNRNDGTTLDSGTAKRNLRSESDRMSALACICCSALCEDLFANESVLQGQKPLARTYIVSFFEDVSIKDNLNNVTSKSLFREELFVMLIESYFQLSLPLTKQKSLGMESRVIRASACGTGYGASNWTEPTLEVVDVCRPCVKWDCDGGTYAIDCYPKLLVRLCREASDKSAKAFWAIRQLGYLPANQMQWSEAIQSLQRAIRGFPICADLWEALDLAHERMGMFTTTLKSYGRAIKLDDSMVFAFIESGNISLMLGSFRKGVEQFQQALKIFPHNASAHYGLASTLLGLAKEYVNLGAFGWGASLLKEASEVAMLGISVAGNFSSCWKLHGDIQLMYARCYPWTEEARPRQADETSFSSITTWKRTCFLSVRNTQHGWNPHLAQPIVPRPPLKPPP